jgi:hypothetical protein
LLGKKDGAIEKKVQATGEVEVNHQNI